MNILQHVRALLEDDAFVERYDRVPTIYRYRAIMERLDEYRDTDKPAAGWADDFPIGVVCRAYINFLGEPLLTEDLVDLLIEAGRSLSPNRAKATSVVHATLWREAKQFGTVTKKILQDSHDRGGLRQAQWDTQP